MARNAEKAHATMNRWLRYQADQSEWGIRRTSGVSGYASQQAEREASRQRDRLEGVGAHDRRRLGRRPFRASEVTVLREAERWRLQVVRETAAAVVEVQDDSLPDDTLRELNDRVNRLMNEQRHWEARIVELGGPDHGARNAAATAAAAAVADFVEAPATAGGRSGTARVRYFGAARNLPEVKALYEAQKRGLDPSSTAEALSRRQRRGPGAPQTAPEGEEFSVADLRAAQTAAREPLDATYFGLDPDSPALLAAETKASKLILARIVQDYHSQGAAAPATAANTMSNDDDDDGGGGGDDDDVVLVLGPEFHVPTQAEVEAALLRKRQEALLARFGGTAAAAAAAAGDANKRKRA